MRLCKACGMKPNTIPLGQRYWSCTPYLLAKTGRDVFVRTENTSRNQNTGLPFGKVSFNYLRKYDQDPNDHDVEFDLMIPDTDQSAFDAH